MQQNLTFGESRRPMAIASLLLVSAVMGACATHGGSRQNDVPPAPKLEALQCTGGEETRYPKESPRVHWCARADTQLDGPYESFHDNGQLAARGQYKEGHEVGVWEYWLRDGQKVAAPDHAKGKEGPIVSPDGIRNTIKCPEGSTWTSVPMEHELEVSWACKTSSGRTNGPSFTWKVPGNIVHFGWLVDGRRVGVSFQMENQNKAVESHHGGPLGIPYMSVGTMSPGRKPAVSVADNVLSEMW